MVFKRRKDILVDRKYKDLFNLHYILKIVYEQYLTYLFQILRSDLQILSYKTSLS
jgi:hypothetical protein